MIEFWTSLIIVSDDQTPRALQSLKDCCTYVANDCWIFEGDIECLDDDGVIFHEIAEGAVPALGDMTTKEKVQLCIDVFGVNVYEQYFKRKTL